MVGAGVLGGIALVSAIVILSENRGGVTDKKPPDEPGSIRSVRVIDGDTIEVDAETLRLHGIDAPEKGQPCTSNNLPYDCGAASKSYLEFMLTGKRVVCTKRGKDKWGRLVAECTADGEDVGKLMVRHGWALAYKEYSVIYLEDEAFARSNKLGIWSKEFSLPSEWRKSRGGKNP